MKEHGQVRALEDELTGQVQGVSIELTPLLCSFTVCLNVLRLGSNS